MPETMRYAQAVNHALRLLMSQDERVFMAGEDIGIYGGAFGVTDGLLDAFGEELIRVIREIQLGKTRIQALRAMSERVDLSDLRSVVNALIQADELGVSIGSILRIQSDQMRLRRFERAEKLANEAPVKMLIPLLFIFVTTWVILAAPLVFEWIYKGSP